MKKLVSILAVVLVFTMMMSLTSFAAASFSVKEDATIDENTTVTPAADSIAVTTATTAGNYYGILLVEGNALPTVDTDILYINQVTADAETETFDVLPIIPEAGDVTLYISSNVAGAELISVPMTYGEEVVVPAGPNVTLMNGAEKVAAELVTDAEGNVTLPADVAFNGTNLVSGYNLTLYSWVTVTSVNEKTGYPVEGVEYLAGAKAAAADLEGKTLYAKYVCDKLYGDLDANGTINGTDAAAVKYKVLNKMATLQKNAGKTMYVINK